MSAPAPKRDGLEALRDLVERLEAEYGKAIERERPKLTLIQGGRDAS